MTATEKRSTRPVVIPDPTAVTEEISLSIMREWLENRRIVVYTVRDTTRATVDICYDQMSKTYQEWPADRIYLGLNDFSGKGSVLTPYVQKRLRDLQAVRPDLHGYVAIVMPQGLLGQLVRLFVRANPAPVRKYNVFFSRTDGLRWLFSRLNEKPGAHG